jgi:sigma-B regulation protein RsbU (phosphoserine phosphatase)
MSDVQGSLLLVDDDDMTRGLLARYLERHGLTVHGVADGQEALDRLERDTFDLVLLDILMEGLSGLDILRTIRSRLSPTDLPVIMATSKDEPADVVQALQLGASDYVTKPFDYPVVLARVRTQLALKRSVDQIRSLEQSLARRNAELETANRRMSRDLATATQVQRALLPGAVPEPPGIRFAWQFRPCTELAGDLLNIIPLDDRRVALYVLDVVGHGVAAALVAVMVNRVLGQLRLTGGLASPVEVAEHLNREFSWDPQTGQFFTLLYGILDLDAGDFRFINAGHPGPLHLPRGGPANNFRLPGSPIGLAEDAYEEHSVTLRPGDRLYLYSDGIPEALNPELKGFGTPRLLERIEQGRTTPLADSLDHLLRAVQDWCGAEGPHDDISLLAVERV